MTKDISSALRPAVALTALFALLLGIVFPLAITALGQAVFPVQANGSLIRDGDKIVGSSLIGQGFTSDRYFHPRPSAAGKGYDGLASAGSNLGPAAQALTDRVKADIAAQKLSAPGRNVPHDLVTTSASGLDPHISPEAALYQVDRVAAARGMAPAQVRALAEGAVEHPALGFFGEPRVNVLLLNRALDGATPGR